MCKQCHGFGVHPQKWVLGLVWLLLMLVPAQALQAVKVPLEAEAIDLIPALERHRSENERLQISTAPGPDGIVRRIEVRARDNNMRPEWVVFALSNDTDQQIDRFIVAPHHRLAESGVLWPDLGASRMTAITASQGDRPERTSALDADVFRITLDPGSTVTYVVELRTSKLPQLYLWEPEAYGNKENAFNLYNGIVIGICALLALLLTVLSLIRGTVLFPAAASIAWSILALIAIQFGFWQKLLNLQGDEDHFWRASAEATLSATLIVFLFAYLNLNRWHVRYIHVALGWLILLILLVALAFFNAPIAAGIARLSLFAVAAAGLALVLSLAAQGFDRAVMLIPTWALLALWVLVAALIVTGQVANDLAGPALVGGLVIIGLLIGFTVLQHAFQGGSFMPGALGETERKAYALVGSGDAVFDWDVVADKINVAPEVALTLGLAPEDLETSAAAWLDLLHPTDQDRWRATLDAVIEKGRGRLALDMRLRATDGHYQWYRLRARPVISSEAQVIRVVGTLTDVTDQRTAEERLLQDAVHDSLTGLPNRALFLDRLETALMMSTAEMSVRPTVMVIDIDRFSQVNESVGFAVGDTILLTVARRLARILKPQDTLGRLGGDQFGVLLLSEPNTEQVPEVADLFRKTIKVPIMLGDREVIISASIGLTLADPASQKRRGDAVADAELAAVHAKRLGGDRIEVFRPSLRTARGDRLALETDLRRALERAELQVLYQPVVRIKDRTIVGFEALLRWDHPRLGRLLPADFIPVAEETGLISGLGLFVLEKATRELAAWQQALPVEPPLFVAVNISSRQLLRHDLVHDVKMVLTRSQVAKGSLKLEITESLVMENPEFAAHMLERLAELGASIALDDFGTGYSSLAYLQRFPVSTIKIDRSLVKGLERHGKTSVLRSVVGLAHDLEMDIIAEGAETEADAKLLEAEGCTYAQGFYYGQPMTSQAVRRLLRIET